MEIDKIFGFDIENDIVELIGLQFGTGANDLEISLTASHKVIFDDLVSGDFANATALDFGELFLPNLTVLADADESELTLTNEPIDQLEFDVPDFYCGGGLFIY